jgi:hypothetical protein
MESRLQVMLAAVQTVRPALERFYQSLSDEQKARFNAIAPTDDTRRGRKGPARSHEPGRDGVASASGRRRRCKEAPAAAVGSLAAPEFAVG